MSTKFWKSFEDGLHDHFAEMREELRWKYALDADTVPDEWARSIDGFQHSRRVDTACRCLFAYVGSGFTEPPAGFDALLNELRAKPIRQVLRENPLAALRRAVRGDTSDESTGPPKPYVVETDPLELLVDLTRAELGPKTIGWEMSRLVELAGLGLRARSERGRAYLHRLGMCWIRGLEHETITSARSLLEAELEHALNRGGILDDVGSDLTLSDSIILAASHGLLVEETFTAADRIRDFGNVSLHVAPGLCDGRRTLEDLATVLCRLQEGDEDLAA